MMCNQTQNLLLLVSMMMMTACSIATKTPSTTQYLAPIVECQESKPASDIDAAPKLDRIKYVQMTLGEKNTYLKQHIAAYQTWAISTIGKVKERDIYRKDTADCLTTLRTKGVIK